MKWRPRIPLPPCGVRSDSGGGTPAEGPFHDIRPRGISKTPINIFSNNIMQQEDESLHFCVECHGMFPYPLSSQYCAPCYWNVCKELMQEEEEYERVKPRKKVTIKKVKKNI